MWTNIIVQKQELYCFLFYNLVPSHRVCKAKVILIACISGLVTVKVYLKVTYKTRSLSIKANPPKSLKPNHFVCAPFPFVKSCLYKTVKPSIWYVSAVGCSVPVHIPVTPFRIFLLHYVDLNHFGFVFLVFRAYLEIDTSGTFRL